MAGVMARSSNRSQRCMLNKVAMHILIALQRDVFQAGGNGNLAAKMLLQQLFVETLDRGQNGQLPLRIFTQCSVPRDRPPTKASPV